MASNGTMARRSFHRIWIAAKKNVSETGPWLTDTPRRWIYGDYEYKVGVQIYS